MNMGRGCYPAGASDNSRRTRSLTAFPSARPLVCGTRAPMTLPMSARPAGAGRRHRVPRQPLELVLGQRLGQELAEHGDLRLLGVGQLPTAARPEQLDALSPLLDLAVEDLDHLGIGQLVAELDLAVVGRRHGHPQGVHPLRVAGLHGRAHGGSTIGLEAHRAHRENAIRDRSASTDPGGRLDARTLALLGFLALALHAGLLVVLAAPCLGQDAGLLDLLVEPSQRALERLVLAHANFRQTSRLLSADVSAGGVHADPVSRTASAESIR